MNFLKVKIRQSFNENFLSVNLMGKQITLLSGSYFFRSTSTIILFPVCGGMGILRLWLPISSGTPALLSILYLWPRESQDQNFGGLMNQLGQFAIWRQISKDRYISLDQNGSIPIYSGANQILRRYSSILFMLPFHKVPYLFYLFNYVIVMVFCFQNSDSDVKKKVF